MNWLSIDFNQTFHQLSPTFFTGDNFKMFTEAFAKPLQDISNEILYKMQHDSRVIYLEKVLNEYLNVVGYDFNDHLATRMIYITDAPPIERDYIFLEGEPDTLWMHDELSSDVEWIDVTPEVYYHFIINVHESLLFEMEKFKLVVDYYKLAGKKYIIQTYS